MSLIACTSHCVYQQDGFCSLERAASSGEPSGDNACVNFVPLRGKSASPLPYPAGSGDKNPS
ncbi:hypothetical protein SAMN02745168_1281 [Papillibacter cinnamivorans DSM 12816]|uniref:DUF1540 domain-containing protein n=1 Tax=Papillibacter cinnamivorans DSM 12816 TaxID=1122930 RepID=A0A1W1ZPI9_9FIRM|nr:hypothetical protein SAMN02745168_1281 [Papillibacter cinnamivorans DSM 12816]